MIRNSIFTILKRFSKEEITRLEAFINSPYHNKSKKVKLFFKKIKKLYPDFEQSNSDKINLIKRRNSSLGYNDSTFRNLMSDLLCLIEKFLIVEKLFDNEWERNVFLLKSLIDKNQETLFEKNIEKSNAELERKGIDSTFYYNKSILELCKYNFNIINRKEKSGDIIDNNTTIISSYLINLVIFFITELINSYLKLSIYELKFNKRDKKNSVLQLIELININEICKHLNKTSEDSHVVDIYLQLFSCFHEIENQEHFIKYKSLIFRFSRYFSKDELSYHYSMMMSYCVIKNSISRDKLQMDIELFEVYNVFLKEELFMNEKTIYLNEDLYRNILITSLRLKKYDWTLSFINNYSKYLHPGKVKNLVDLSYAEYNYQMGSESGSSQVLEKAFKHLNNIHDESIIIKYDIKTLYLMLYYDLNYVDENILTQLNNYRRFLKRNKLVSDVRKKRLNKFLNLFEKLVFLKAGDPKIDISKLYLDILTSDGLTHYKWLLSKIQELNTLNTSRIKLG